MKTRKFNRNPINQLKLEINKIITANNAKKDNLKMLKIIDDYKQDYIYRNIKKKTLKLYSPYYYTPDLLSVLLYPRSPLLFLN